VLHILNAAMINLAFGRIDNLTKVYDATYNLTFKKR
jgi:hypothetical protein